MAGIFISYRREDSGASAGRLYDRLREHFGDDKIFMDLDSIEPGLDFIEVIERTIASCDVLIALIGRQWLMSTDAAGQRRLDDPEDFVRREIVMALRRNIRVIPILIQGTSMPRAATLSDDLQPLTRRNAVELSDMHFRRDVDQLIVVLDRVLGVPPPPSAPSETEVPHVPPPVRSSYLRSWKFWGFVGLLFAGMAVIVVVSVAPLVKMPTSSSPLPSARKPPPPPSDTSSSPRLTPPMFESLVKSEAQPTIKVQELGNPSNESPTLSDEAPRRLMGKELGSLNDSRAAQSIPITEGKNTWYRFDSLRDQYPDFFKFTASSPKTRVILDGGKNFFLRLKVYNNVMQEVSYLAHEIEGNLSFESTPGSTYYIEVRPLMTALGTAAEEVKAPEEHRRELIIHTLEVRKE
jgi:hypothetical protein